PLPTRPTPPTHPRAFSPRTPRPSHAPSHLAASRQRGRRQGCGCSTSSSTVRDAASPRRAVTSSSPRKPCFQSGSAVNVNGSGPLKAPRGRALDVQRDDRLDLGVTVLLELCLEQPAGAGELCASSDELCACVRDEAPKPVPVLVVVIAFDRRATACAKVLRSESIGRNVCRAPRRIERVTQRRNVRRTAAIDRCDPRDASTLEEALLLGRKPAMHGKPPMFGRPSCSARAARNRAIAKSVCST